MAWEKSFRGLKVETWDEFILSGPLRTSRIPLFTLRIQWFLSRCPPAYRCTAPFSLISRLEAPTQTP